MTSPIDAEIRAQAARVAKCLLDAGLTLSVAESCTGGWVAKACTDLPGSSGWFEGGVVTYSNKAKERILGVGADTIRRAGAVSEATVREMAYGALDRFDSDVALAVSGIAGPDGGMPGKPVGTIWFAWAFDRGDQREIRAEVQVFEGDREAVRRQAVMRALAGVLEA
ncbi:MAG: CinA family protein [Steroidobacteraceae bacterium]|nr:CinA family protein [Steroidobacteraceae bacterium]